MKKSSTNNPIECSAKSNKRSLALKSILENQNGSESFDKKSLPPSRKNAQKDLLSGTSQTLPQSIELFHGLIHRELAKAAIELGIDEVELKAWIDLQIEVPAKTILNLLRMMQSLHLDPLSEEIFFAQYEDGQWQVFITIEGCAKLLNQHPQFNGLAFNQADTLIDGVPEWIECSIYRKDREVPTTVREYYTEVRGENAIWQKMPRRILRHRALQQCVRLAIA